VTAALAAWSYKLNGSSSSYGSDGSTPALSGSLGLNAFA
jgi:hypothetical protein